MVKHLIIINIKEINRHKNDRRNFLYDVETINPLNSFKC